MNDEKLPIPATAAQISQQTDQHISQKWKRSRFFIRFIGITILLIWLRSAMNINLLPSIKRPCHSNMPEQGNPSRQIIIDAGSESVSARFNLYDLLYVKSASGGLFVDVVPQPDDKDAPAPANLVVESRSGGISVNFPVLKAPERTYRSSIGSAAGSVEGTILHGESTSITTESGSINVEITPFVTGKKSSTLGVSSGSASQEVTVSRPAITSTLQKSEWVMISQHDSRSGSIVLRYPREWQGSIEGTSLSGSIKLHGVDADEIMDVVKMERSHVVAKRGKGNSTLNVSTGSGSVDVYFR